MSIQEYKGGGNMIQLFKALSDETRLRILSVVWQGEMCVCEIEQALGLTQSNASRHLTVLKNAGLITGVKRAQWMYYIMNEQFGRDHAALLAYLQIQLKVLDSYKSDIEHLNNCKNKNLCNCK
jgi:ArsR family transcriptional regulator